MTKTNNPLPPWADLIPKGSFISYAPTYKVGEYFNRFHKDVFKPSNFNNLNYYYYDPTEHGFPKDKQYPLITFLHGATNALEGDVCINYTGAEFYSKESYQKTLGGAFLLIPLANEYRDQDGNVKGGWHETPEQALYELIAAFIKNKMQGNCSKNILIGNSAGALMSFKMVNKYTAFFDALIPVGACEIPDDETLDRYDQENISLFYAIAKHDELNNFDTIVRPRLERLKAMKNCFIYTPEWVQNGDKGIASINFGKEMGQHCLVNPMHCNLMFDDGTPMEPLLPDGVTGWIKGLLNNYFTVKAISKEQHQELIKQKSDSYDSTQKYNLLYSEKLLQGDGTPTNPYKIEASIQNVSEQIFEGIIRLELTAETTQIPSFYLPGFMYGTNRGDKPWKVDCKFPRLRPSITHPADSDCPLSSFYMVRADRLSHPCALMYLNDEEPKIIGFHTSPYYCENFFVQYGGFSCNAARKTVGFTFGYENAPWLFIQSHTILPRQEKGNYFTLKPHQTISQTFFVYDYKASSPVDIHEAIKNVYTKYHEYPRTTVSTNEAIKDLALAICDYAWLSDKKCYSGFVREDGIDEAGKEKFSYNVIPSISWTNGIVVAYPQLVASARLNNTKMKQQALTCIQNIVDNSLNKNSSLPYETFDGNNWSCKGWWYDGMHNGGHSAYLDGQFIYYLLKAYQFEKQNGKNHEDWLSFTRLVISTFERERNCSGEYPFIFSIIEVPAGDFDPQTEKVSIGRGLVPIHKGVKFPYPSLNRHLI